MVKKWYKNPFNWLVLLALVLPGYFAIYSTLGGKVMGWVDFLVSIGIPHSLLIGILQGLQIFCMLAIPTIVIVVMVLGIKNWREDKQKAKVGGKLLGQISINIGINSSDFTDDRMSTKRMNDFHKMVESISRDSDSHDKQPSEKDTLKKTDK